MGKIASQITSLTIVYSTVYSGADQRKHQSSASLAFVRGIHRWPMNNIDNNDDDDNNNDVDDDDDNNNNNNSNNNNNNKNNNNTSCSFFLPFKTFVLAQLTTHVEPDMRNRDAAENCFDKQINKYTNNRSRLFLKETSWSVSLFHKTHRYCCFQCVIYVNFREQIWVLVYISLTFVGQSAHYLCKKDKLHIWYHLVVKRLRCNHYGS